MAGQDQSPAPLLAQSEAPQPTAAEIHKELAAIRQEVEALRALGHESWMTDRRREEVRRIIEETLADGELRSSRAGSGVAAGHDGKFFIASEDGKFRFNVNFRIQMRYIYNLRTEPEAGPPGSNVDENEQGFVIRRPDVQFSGHALDPALTWGIKAQFSRSDGDYELEEAFVRYALDSEWYIMGGQFTGRFLREELVSSGKQIAAERSNINEFFTIDYAQGVEIGRQGSSLGWSAAIHDGRENDNTDFAADSTEFAAFGRVEWLVMGTWKQFEDFAVWPSDKPGLLLGAAMDYAQMDHGSGTTSNLRDYLAWTVDATFEAYPFALFAAFITRHGALDDDGATAGRKDIDQWAVLVQGSVMIVPDKMDLFVRWEHLDQDGFGEFGHLATPVGPSSSGGFDDELDILTFGGNWYLARHSEKFTLDLLWAPDGLRIGESPTGTLANTEGGSQAVLRAQYQLQF